MARSALFCSIYCVILFMCYMNSVLCIYLKFLAIGLNKIFLIPDSCQRVLQLVIQGNLSSTQECHHACKYQPYVTLFQCILSSLLLAFLRGNNLPLDRLVESCGTSRLEFLQLDFSNLNSVFNIDIFNADLPADNVDKILALGDINGIHTYTQLVSDSIPVIIIGLNS